MAKPRPVKPKILFKTRRKVWGGVVPHVLFETWNKVLNEVGYDDVDWETWDEIEDKIHEALKEALHGKT